MYIKFKRGICRMDIFHIPEKGKDNDSVNRTIRFRGQIYDKLMDIVDQRKISFNFLVNEALSFALERLDDGNNRK